MKEENQSEESIKISDQETSLPSTEIALKVEETNAAQIVHR